MNKTLSREKLYQLLFAEDFLKYQNFEDEDFERAINLSLSEDNKKLNDEEKEFIKINLKNILENLEEIKKKINSVLSGYTFSSLAPTDRAILSVAVYELIKTDTPEKIVIAEAVKLAKKFGGEKSSKFVNGVLSGVSRSE